ncbi:MAG TPA: phosphorylase [Cytophagales bacterium]|nr:phosphorylase [Cytophagales bacterium]
MPISPTDLILNPDGSVYHLSLLPKHIADTVIAVGDPNRVGMIAEYLDSIDYEVNKREFITITGKFNSRRITVISTGIGTDNVEIVLTELDALVNVDLKIREPKARKKRLRIIRLGTSGALQEDVAVGSHVISEFGIGLDNLMMFYRFSMNEWEYELAGEIQHQAGLPFQPYVVEGSASLLKQLGADMVAGNTVTCPGFYAPQGRQVRASTALPDLLDKLTFFHYQDFWLTNFEMETSAYYALGRLLGHDVISLNAIIANRVKNEFAKDPYAVVRSLIEKTLDVL